MPYALGSRQNQEKVLPLYEANQVAKVICQQTERKTKI